VTPASLLLLLPVLPVVFALVVLLAGEGTRRRSAWLIALAAGLCLGVALLAPERSLALPKLLVEATSFLKLDETSRAILLLCGSVWLSCALAWPGDREEDTLAGPMLLIALAGGATLAVAEGGSLVFASLLAIGYALYGRVAIAPGEFERRGGRALVVLLVSSDVLLFELLLDLAAHPSAPPSTFVWLLALAATVLRGAIPPAHGWLPMALAGARPADAALLASVPPAVAILGISRILPAAGPDGVEAMAGLGALGALAAAALALTRRDARSTLGYASASTAALLLTGLPALLGDAKGGATAWHVVALAAALAVPPLAGACRRLRLRDAILSSAVAVHALAAASFALAANAGAPALPAAGAGLAAVLSTLCFALAARRSRETPVGVPTSAGVAAIPILAAVGALVRSRPPDPSLAWAWVLLPMGVAVVAAWRFTRLDRPAAGEPRIPTGDLVVFTERLVRGLARRLTVLFRERLPERCNRIVDALGAWLVDPRWAAAGDRIEARLAHWSVTSLLMLAAATSIAWLLAS
jgi:NADH:ubiquinone oxidoreductase subunit 2 (subunit N)